MIEIYESKGMSPQDAELVVRVQAKYKDFFVDIMMTQELELQVPADDHIKESFREGVVMFSAFAIFGAMPLLGYVIIPSAFPESSEEVLFSSACIITAMVLFFMGTVKSGFSTQSWFQAGMETLLLGGACATTAFTVGQLVKSYLGDDVD
jgi:VIT1/CCC1 family predicted Fe2+/Mn2+ transporter